MHTDQHDDVVPLNKPAYARVWLKRGVARQRIGDPDQAMVDLNEAIRLNPDYAEAYSERGLVYWDYFDLDQDRCYLERAIQDFDEAIRLDPACVEAYYNRGNAYFILDQQKQAIRDLAQVIRLDPDFVAAYYNLRDVYHYYAPEKRS
jgi:tetratricopeptide (TPR) repeat protein